MYQPLQASNAVKRIDIITKATDSYDKVTSIYMESVQTFPDSAILNKMIWKTGNFMQLNQQVNYKVVWNNWDETP